VLRVERETERKRNRERERESQRDLTKHVIIIVNKKNILKTLIGYKRKKFT
jgi:hypothetical protein